MSKSSENKRQAHEITAGFDEAGDLGERIEKVVQEISQATGFEPIELIGKSAWWGSTEIGAFHYQGKYEDKDAVLKVQGVKPKTSEVFTIQSFDEQNKSKIIRPPRLLATLPWNDEKGYEAFVMENIGTDRVVSIPTNEAEVGRYYELYRDYRENCRNKPWLDKPKKTISELIPEKFARWKRYSHKLYSNHPYRLSEDEDLINQSIEMLSQGYRGVDSEFVHAHLSDGDLYNVGNQVIVTSNLLWSWRPPFYDGIFAYHWFIYHLADISDITPVEIEKQRSLWLKHINQLAKTPSDNPLLNLALLERATAGLNLDALSVELDKPASKYLVEATRKQVKSLLKKTAG